VVLSPESAPAQVLTATSHEDGRYAFEPLQAGVYRLMAVKSGYTTAVSRVDTALGATLDFVLKPRAPRDRELAEDPDWMLRYPSRDILRSEEPEVAGQPEAQAPAISRSLELPIDGEVQQWFSSDSPLDAPGGAQNDSSGTLTTVHLAMQVSQRLDLGLSGEIGRDDLRSASALTGPGAVSALERTSAADRVGVTMGLATGEVSRLRMEARYSRDIVSLGEGQSFGSIDGESHSVTRSWQGQWHSAIGRSGTVDVSALYIDAIGREFDAAAQAADPVVNRLWRAGGRYATSVGEDHQVEVGFGARVLELDGPTGRQVARAGVWSPVTFAGPGSSGLALHLRGAEAWTALPALTVDVGVDYRRTLETVDVEYLIPQAGVVWAPFPATKVRAGVSWASEQQRGQAALDVPPSAMTDLSDDSRMGYVLQIQQRIGDQTVISISGEFTPVSFEAADFAAAEFADFAPTDQVYMSEGEASSHEVGLAVEQRWPGLTARVEAKAGRLDGRYAATIPGEPVWALQDGVFEYAVGKLSALTQRSGSEVILEIRDLSDAAGLYADGPRQELTLVTFRIAQDLPFIHLGETRWRFLFGTQNVVRQWAADTKTTGGGMVPTLAAENRVAGGVSVQF